MTYNARSSFLGFYYVDKNYADYLRNSKIGDRHIPLTEYEKGKKFFVGAVLMVGKHKYYAPVTSYKGQNDATFNIRDEHNQVLSSVRLNYMFPVNDDVCKKFDINNCKDLRYKFWVLKEYQYCNKHKEEICKIAQEIYSRRLNGQRYTNDKMYINNFMKLEKAANKYDASVKTVSQLDPLQAKYKLTDKQFASVKRFYDRELKGHSDSATLEKAIRNAIYMDENGNYDPAVKAQITAEIDKARVA